MGRMHSGGKGIAGSALPYKRSPPSWLKVTSSQVEDHVCKLAKRGLTPSQVSVRSITQSPRTAQQQTLFQPISTPRAHRQDPILKVTSYC